MKKFSLSDFICNNDEEFVIFFNYDVYFSYLLILTPVCQLRQWFHQWYAIKSPTIAEESLVCGKETTFFIRKSCSEFEFCGSGLIFGLSILKVFSFDSTCMAGLELDKL